MNDYCGNVRRSSCISFDVGPVRPDERQVFIAGMRTERMLLNRIIQLSVILFLLSAAVRAQDPVTPGPSPTPNQASSEDSKKEIRDPIESADEYKSKLTFSVYFTPGDQAFDLNLRHQLGPFTVW